MAKTAATYSSTATYVPDDKDNSLVNQERRFGSYAIGNGYSIVRAFRDERVKAERPDLKRMVALVESGQANFEVVLVDSYSRLFRDPTEATTFIETLRKRGIEIISISQPVPPGPAGAFLGALFVSLDAHLSAETAKHVERSMGRNARQGYWCGGRPPYGYTTAQVGRVGSAVRKKLVVEPAEAASVQLIFDLYLKGDDTSGSLSVKNVAEWLNHNGYRSRNNFMWSIGKIRKVLTNRTFTGTYEFGRTKKDADPVPVPVPVIIPSTIFDAAQRRSH